MTDVAKKRIKNKGILVIGDSEKLPFANQSFDIVYCNDSFHHYPEPKKGARRSMARYLFSVIFISRSLLNKS